MCVCRQNVGARNGFAKRNKHGQAGKSDSARTEKRKAHKRCSFFPQCFILGGGGMLWGWKLFCLHLNIAERKQSRKKKKRSIMGTTTNQNGEPPPPGRWTYISIRDNDYQKCYCSVGRACIVQGGKTSVDVKLGNNAVKKGAASKCKPYGNKTIR